MSDTNDQNAERIATLSGEIRSESDSSRLAELLVERGHELQSAGEHVRSVEDYLRALELSHDSRLTSHARAMISLALLRAGEKEQAMWWAVGSVDADSNALESHLALGLACVSSEYEKVAISEFRRALEIDAGHLQARLELAKALREAGKLDEAADELQRCIRAAPDNARLYFELAWTTELNIRRADRIPEAIRNYQLALQTCTDPDWRRRIEEKLECCIQSQRL